MLSLLGILIGYRFSGAKGIRYVAAVAMIVLFFALIRSAWNFFAVLDKNAIDSLQNYLFPLIGFAAYFVLKILLAILGRNLEFAETFCHELNHTFFALLSFRKIESFSAHAEEGGSVTFYGRHNPMISLAPCTFPLFAFFVSLLSLILIPEARKVAQGLVGFFVAFHGMSVFHEARPYQTDLQIYGYFFSYAAILFFNLLWIPFVILLCEEGFSAALMWPHSAILQVQSWITFIENSSLFGG